jgi:nucleosome binding factor SPN SPT16 subunit
MLRLLLAVFNARPELKLTSTRMRGVANRHEMDLKSGTDCFVNLDVTPFNQLEM